MRPMTKHQPNQPTIESPCISVCQIDGDSGYCLGCWRTLEEVSRWRGFTEDEKRDVLDQLCDRRRAAGVTNERDERRRVRKLQARTRRG